MINIPKGITRIEIPARRTFGYMVRLRRGDHAVNEFFSDAKHGGKNKAKKAAKSHYQEILSIALPSNTSHKNIPTKRNRSGKVGVRTSVSFDKRDTEKKYFSWTAFWSEKNGSRHTVSFSWNKYGKEPAYELASIARDQEMIDREQVESLHSRAGSH